MNWRWMMNDFLIKFNGANLNKTAVMAIILFCGSVLANAPTTKPATSPAALAILDRLEKTSDTYKTLQADINYTVEMRMTGETEQRKGWVAFQKKTAKTVDKFRIHFDTLRLDGGRPVKSPLDYIFDGYWLIIAKHKIKSMTRVEIAKPGEKVEPLKIGKGPFPVPFGQKTADMIEYLEITTRNPRKSDPKGTSYLKMIPRKKYKEKLGFRKMEIWVDNKTNLPVKVVSKDKNKNITTVEFTDIKTGNSLKPKLFSMNKPAGWDMTVEKLKR